MPIYEYQCEACGEQFEQLVKLDAPLPACPKCAATQVRKKVSAVAFALKGSGWYKDHYGLKSSGGGSGSGESSGGGSSAAAPAAGGSAAAPAKTATPAPAQASSGSSGSGSSGSGSSGTGGSSSSAA